MPNKVFNSTLIQQITKNGKTLALKYATQTETWTRTYLAQSVKDDFSETIGKADVPANAASAILAEKEHPSQNDSKDHFTTVFEDSEGNHITTKHLYK